MMPRVHTAQRLQPTESGGPRAPDKTEKVHALLAQAAHEARGGRHVQAIDLLNQAAALEIPVSARTLDLRARVCAQLGYLLEAERAWTEAMRLDGSNPSYTKALDRLRRYSRSTSRLPALIGSLAALLLFGLIAANALRQSSAIDHLEAASVETEQSMHARLQEAEFRLTETIEQASASQDETLRGGLAELVVALESATADVVRISLLEQRFYRLYEVLEARDRERTQREIETRGQMEGQITQYRHALASVQTQIAKFSEDLPQQIEHAMAESRDQLRAEYSEIETSLRTALVASVQSAIADSETRPEPSAHEGLADTAQSDATEEDSILIQPAQ